MKYVLDLFCGAGGASVGINRAGFKVIGVDIQDQPNYPFQIIKDDVMKVLTELLSVGWYRGPDNNVSKSIFDSVRIDMASIAWIWASPPCQAASWSARRWKKKNKYPDLIPATRDLLIKSGKPYVIENVIGARLIKPIKLSGPQFGLGVIKTRLFESNVPLKEPLPAKRTGSVKDGTYVTVAGHGGDGSASYEKWCTATGIDWMNKRLKHNGTKASPGNKNDLAEAIPPAYSEWIAKQMKSV